jgi:hypothetical protein
MVHVTKWYSYKTVHSNVKEIIDSEKLCYFISPVEGKIWKEKRVQNLSLK